MTVFAWPEDNPTSWAAIRVFVSERPDDAYWTRWKSMVGETIAELEERNLVPYFRIGQSMHHIIFSTLDRHVMSSEPRVTLEFLPDEKMVRVAYGTANLYFAEPLSEKRVVMAEAVPVVLVYLRRLWEASKPLAQIPPALAAA